MGIRGTLQSAAWRVLVFLGVVSFVESVFFNTGRIARNKHGGLSVLDPAHTDPSYLLLAAFNTGDYKGNEGRVRLTDLYGATLHSWRTPLQTSGAQLLPNGDLIVSLLAPDNRDPSTFPGSSRTGILQKLGWEGEVLWEYRHPGMHNCFEVLPNGHVLVAVWEEVDKHTRDELLSPALAAGRERIWSDVVLEIDRQGTEVWRWRAVEYLDHTLGSLENFPHRVEWAHTNGIHYVEKNPFDGGEALLLSMRNLDRICMVSKKTKTILWTSPEGMFAGQHDPTYTVQGTVLAFDNGLHRRPRSRSEAVFSRVLEVDPLTNTIVWSIEGGTTSSERAQLYESLMCGAQRLRNGNTHVTLSCSGHMFELTPEKKMVWDFVSPYTTYGDGLWPNTAVLNARRYRQGDIAWPQPLPPPLPARPPYRQLYISLNP